MDTNTVLIDLRIDLNSLNNRVPTSDVELAIKNVLHCHFEEVKELNKFELKDATCCIYMCDGCGTVDMKIYKDGLITLILDYKGRDQEVWMKSFKVLEKDIQDRISTLQKCPLGENLNNKKLVLDCFAFPPIKRGAFGRYFLTTDDRIFEYDVEKVLFEKRSQYQKVQIVYTKSFGNMLLLDGLQNYSEHDGIYTETLMGKNENYSGKEILILGGGDGALLKKLLDHQPKEVIMVEIDEVVMKACSEYMESVCGNVFKQKNGPNYKIIVGDCFTVLNNFISQGRKFDYVFGDLTDVPITETPIGDTWDFLLRIFSNSLKVMKPESKFMTHITASMAEDAVKTYVAQVKLLEPTININIVHAYIPSYYENWAFAQIYFSPTGCTSDSSSL